MDSKLVDEDWFVRIDPGEPLVRSLADAAARHGINAAVIVSGVGMLSEVEIGFFDAALDDYRRSTIRGVHDVSSIQGNITMRDGSSIAHVHAVFNDESYKTFSGHVMEAICHITMEVFLSVSPISIRRVKLPGCPATRIV